ncbi:flagellar FliJ protein [Anaerovirgula multivorans]|uniref:Flagellar FliJ protein n=1 Tax=Anaerovirgula multivorans TaxID=312168 RepID=A0A239A2D5_9FIRM|nr:flagellar FliJ family protein [Anaerovirgula multivorans]SNR89807.1 flagellar FliJ protein [Anaerovirgula multivorans]
MAMTFSYRFNNILKIKEKTEEDKINQLASDQKRLDKEKNSLQLLLDKKDCNLSKWKEITRDNNVVSIKDLQNASMDIQSINHLVENQFVTVKKHELKLNESRNQLIEAKKQTKIFEKLKEKDYDYFKNIQLKNEATLIDQLVTFKSTVSKGG